MVEGGRRFGIKSETIKTEIAEHKDPSWYGVPKRRFALTASGTDGETYIQLGEHEHVQRTARIDKELNPTTSVSQAFKYLDGQELKPLATPPLEAVRSEFVDGEGLVEGPLAIPGAPGDAQLIVPNRSAVWAPIYKALGEEWTLTKES